jgi:hypothetical protein
VSTISTATREIVRERADRRCEYCRKPEGISVYPHHNAWDDHFQLIDDKIVGKTPTGQTTVQLLQINHPEQVEMRRLLIAAGLWYVSFALPPKT